MVAEEGVVARLKRHLLSEGVGQDVRREVLEQEVEGALFEVT